jgi:hypothetical protein
MFGRFGNRIPRPATLDEVALGVSSASALATPVDAAEMARSAPSLSRLRREIVPFLPLLIGKPFY